MKKLVLLTLAVLVLLFAVTGCTTNEQPAADDGAQPDAAADKVITVGASITPHAEILAQCKDILAENGYELVVKEFDDYVLPNEGVTSGDLDANYFQHQPYLDSYNSENNTDIVSAASIHYEPLGIYAGRTASINEIPDGAKIAVPNDPSNEARALLLLEANALITLKEGAGINATKLDIKDNPFHIEIVEVEAAMLPQTLADVDFAVINGNYALQGGLKIADALAFESKDSVAAETYANIIACRNGDENSEKIKALVDALKTDKIKNFIDEKYNGAVVSMF